MKLISGLALVLALASACTGYIGDPLEGLSRDEGLAYTRSDRSCDEGRREREPACYVSTRPMGH